MLKKIAIGLVVSLIVVGSIGYYCWSNLDSLIKSAIEKYGSAATQTAVILDNVKLSIATGEGSLNGISVKNPPGFTSPLALYLNAISIKIDPQSVTGSGPIIIKDLTIEKPQVTYEIALSGGTNLQTIVHNTQNYAGKSQTVSTPEPEDTSRTDRKIIIESLTISDGQISLIKPSPRGNQLTALPTIHMENIGKSSGGISSHELTQLLLGTLAGNVANVAEHNIPKRRGDKP